MPFFQLKTLRRSPLKNLLLHLFGPVRRAHGPFDQRQDVDVLIPAALEGQVNAETVKRVSNRVRMVAEGANGPTTPEADVILNQRPEIFVIPDVICNAGGVIVSYFEWVQDLQSFFWGETEVVDKLFRILETAYTQVVATSRKQKLPIRLAALSLGIKRVQEAKRVRGLFP